MSVLLAPKVSLRGKLAVLMVPVAVLAVGTVLAVASSCIGYKDDTRALPQ